MATKGKQGLSGADESSIGQKNLANQGDKTNGWWWPVALLVLIVTMLVLAQVYGVGERLVDLREWIRGLGAWGPVAFVPFYTLAVVAALPGSALSVVAGALFGSGLGIVVVVHAATLGASLSFLISRYFARDAIAHWLSTNEKFRRLDQLTEEHGAIIVALTRLVPILPFNVLNYGFGLTRVPFWTYVFWSWLCMLPGTILYVVGADTLTQGIAQGEVPWVLIGAMAGGGVLLKAVTLVVSARVVWGHNM